MMYTLLTTYCGYTAFTRPWPTDYLLLTTYYRLLITEAYCRVLTTYLPCPPLLRSLIDDIQRLPHANVVLRRSELQQPPRLHDVRRPPLAVEVHLAQHDLG